MTTFYICRHGESENNSKRRLSGWIDTPLTEQGVRDALSSAAKLNGLHFDKVVSSDLGRAFTSAYIITRELGFKDEIQRLADLREVNYGDLANMPSSDYPDLTPEEKTNYTPPNGESLAHMQDRVLSCLSLISAGNQGKTILVVAHDGTINALRASFAKKSMGEADKTHNPNDFVAQFTLANRKVLSFSEI